MFEAGEGTWRDALVSKNIILLNIMHTSVLF